MTKDISFSVRLDSKLKADAEELFGELGLSLGSAMNIFLRQSVRVQGLPFPICRNKAASAEKAAPEATQEEDAKSSPEAE